jgi:hypothetical protein
MVLLVELFPVSRMGEQMIQGGFVANAFVEPGEIAGDAQVRKARK